MGLSVPQLHRCNQPSVFRSVAIPPSLNYATRKELYSDPLIGAPHRSDDARLSARVRHRSQVGVAAPRPRRLPPFAGILQRRAPVRRAVQRRVVLAPRNVPHGHEQAVLYGHERSLPHYGA